MARQSASAHLLRGRTIRRRTAALAVALAASSAVCAYAAAVAGATTIVVAGDSVLATSLSTFGTATIRATRPDAQTGDPVVIGQYSGFANPFLPFSVNMTAPGALDLGTTGAMGPSGDCWQKGALSQALTPDLQPGDTVTLSQGGFFGGASTNQSVPVPRSNPTGFSGPLAGCDAVAPWARNAITSAPGTTDGGPLEVTGVAQPLTTGVSVSASDGSHVSAPESVKPTADGHWSATIPAADLAGLANAPLTVTPIFTVPDVSTGAPAHIAGVSASLRKAWPPAQTPHSGGPAPAPKGAPAPGHGHRPAPRPRVTALRSKPSVTLTAVRSRGLTASFRVPARARVVEVELLRGGKPMYLTILRVGRGGSHQTQTVRLGDSRLYRRLRRGHYTIAVRAGTSRSTLGAATRHGLTIR